MEAGTAVNRRATYRPLPVQHEVRRVSWSRAITGMVTAGLLVCLLGWAVTDAVFSPPAHPARLDVASVPVPTVTPLPDLTPAVQEITRFTESIYASQPGDSIPIMYTTPRIMEAGEVRLQLTGITVAGEEVEQGKQVVRVELVDALSGEIIGTADLIRQDGVDGDPVVLATLAEPRATYLRVASSVRGDGTCHACEPGEYTYDQPTWHTWTALLQYDRASW